MEQKIIELLELGKNSIFPKNGWFENEKMKVYLRVHKLYDILTLDIATIEVFDRGKGTFSEFLEWSIITARKMGYQRIKIENVLETRFANYFERKGFDKIGNYYPYSYIFNLQE